MKAKKISPQKNNYKNHFHFTIKFFPPPHKSTHNWKSLLQPLLAAAGFDVAELVKNFSV
jgi:hypothetical protein